MTKALVPFQGDPPERRRGILARLFGTIDLQNEVEALKAEHTLVRLAIELNADLTRHRRKAELYLAATKAEDRAATVVAREVKRREILEGIDILFADDPVAGELLKAHVRAIFNGHNGHLKRHKRRKR
jgi:hypothetical protein